MVDLPLLAQSEPPAPEAGGSTPQSQPPRYSWAPAALDPLDTISTRIGTGWVYTPLLPAQPGLMPHIIMRTSLTFATLLMITSLTACVLRSHQSFWPMAYDLASNLDRYLLTLLSYLLLMLLAVSAWKLWKQRRIISYCALMLLISLIAYHHWYFEFNSQRWLRSSEQERYPMVNNLVQRKTVIGKSRDDIIHLLGSPYQPFFPPTGKMIYRVFGGQRSKSGAPLSCNLTILLDNQQRAVSIHLHSVDGKEISELP